MAENRKPPEDPGKILDRIERESDVIGNSALVRGADKARDHLTAKDVDENDSIEVWGTRVGRGLAIVAFAGLAIWLFKFLTRAG